MTATIGAAYSWLAHGWGAIRMMFGGHMWGVALALAAFALYQGVIWRAEGRGADEARRAATDAAIVAAIGERAAEAGIDKADRDQLRRCLTDPSARCVLRFASIHVTDRAPGEGRLLFAVGDSEGESDVDVTRKR